MKLNPNPRLHLEIITPLVILTLLCTSCAPVQTQVPIVESTPIPATATLIPTSTLTETPSPTPLPPLPPTPTPIPGPYAEAMIDWRELGFSDGFIAFPPSDLGIEKGAEGFSLQNNDGSILRYMIEGSFVFKDSDDNPTQYISGYTVLLPSSKDTDAFDYVTQNLLDDFLANGYKVPPASVSYLENMNDIGNSSGGVTVQISRNDAPWRVSEVAFRIDDIGAFVFVRNKSDIESPVNVGEVARAYAKSIQMPINYCRITSVSPLENTLSIPTFKFEADGFYPLEGRYIILEGNILVGGETKSVRSGYMGLTGETVDKDGYLSDTVEFLSIEQLSEVGGQYPSGTNEYTLIIGGHASGCEASQIVSWPEIPVSTPAP